MIVLAKVLPARVGQVPDVSWRPRDRRLAKHATGKARPWLTRVVWVTTDQARPGWVARFVDAEWPKHVLYEVSTEAEARAQAGVDLQRLAAGEAILVKANLAAYYWQVQDTATAHEMFLAHARAALN